MTKLTKQEIKEAIQSLAKSEGVSFIQAASAMQSASARMGNDEIVEIIAELKEESDEYKSIFTQ